ncbi:MULTISPECIES: hypothetical protein [unclassified Streptomyces]|uniref:hypothetical protein n=1 Tax=unclassified Streptomyces TaxID=2593676 RepID=UPI0008059322|nr:MULTISPECIES: hypothetical protein [unclassified Streptomyces]MYR76555.1 hypothetical protein [Streptomyces sp. SID4925]SBV00066.1 hypothetical protein YUMDRAFT_06324 [Streptomyces sp. OspMP-M45]
MSTDAFDLGLQALLAAPTRAHTILTCVAAALRDEDPLVPLTLDVLNEVLHRTALVLTAGLPDVVADEAIERAAQALPTIHPGETPDAYALRVTHAAKGI